MIKKLLAAVVLAVALFAGYVAMQPNDFRYERTATIAAPADKIFALVNSPKKMAEWSPWSKVDPNATITYEGPEAGVGAIHKWVGHSEMGEGVATIMESTPNELVKTKLEFIKPMAATNTVEFALKANGDNTDVVWSMYGTSDFLGKAMGIIFNCEGMINEKFDEGLTNLKTLVEAK